MTTAPDADLSINDAIRTYSDLLELVGRDDIGLLLADLRYDWRSGSFHPDAALASVLASHGLAEKGKLNRIGRLFLARLVIHFDDGEPGSFGSLNERYEDFRTLSSGKNSVVVRARHKLLGTEFILKVVRPGASTGMLECIRRLARLPADTAIVRPVDFLDVLSKDALGREVSLECVVFPVVEGITFRDFTLQPSSHLNSQVAMAFIDQVGRALRDLERIGAYHGDLHEGNILVDRHGAGGLRFMLVDVSFGATGSLSPEECVNGDMAYFRQHIWRLLNVQKATMPSFSIRKHVGTRNYQKIERILSGEIKDFEAVCEVLRSDADYAAYVAAKSEFLSRHFEKPASFRLQRYEEITDAEMAVRLFVPFEQLMTKVVVFGNIYVSGNRGSGKSTYLASLAFFPRAAESIVDFRTIFGVYFPCRQGEFRSLRPRPGWSPQECRAFLTDVLVVKVVRRVLETISAAVGSGQLRQPSSLAALREFVGLFVPAPGLVSVSREIQSEIENFASTMVRVEMDVVGRLKSATEVTGGEKDAGCLVGFFDIVRQTFGELAASRFHLLFDDAGDPHVPKSMQMVVNDLMLRSNPLFCVKLSAEKYTFEFENSDGKPLENGHDYFEHDISQILFIGSGSGGLKNTDLEKYFRHIVEQRLQHFGYKSYQILDYLGDEKINADQLIKLLAFARKDAYYCGWTTVWNIADRTPRNLLEIVSEIFSVANVDQRTDPFVISNRDQDRGIRTISEKRLESLSQISGSVLVSGERVSLGRRLFETTSAIGSTFRVYLRSERAKLRKRQHLAIERNETSELDHEAEEILRKLVTFGVLDAGKAAYARDDNVKKAFYVLNRVYCPAFSIGYRRDEHLRLSRRKLELLLLHPDEFIRQGTRKLRDEGGMTGARDLFDYRMRDAPEAEEPGPEKARSA